MLTTIKHFHLSPFPAEFYLVLFTASALQWRRMWLHYGWPNTSDATNQRFHGDPHQRYDDSMTSKASLCYNMEQWSLQIGWYCYPLPCLYDIALIFVHECLFMSWFLYMPKVIVILRRNQLDTFNNWIHLSENAVTVEFEYDKKLRPPYDCCLLLYYIKTITNTQTH